jgi:hypothetical protein
MHILLTYFFGHNEVQKNVLETSCCMQGIIQNSFQDMQFFFNDQQGHEVVK